MAFLFGLFRFLTYGNLIVVGFFMLMVAMAMILVPSLSAILIFLLVLATVLYHNVLCLRLQKALIQQGNFPLAPNFPSMLVVVSVLSFIYSALVFHNIFSVMRIPDSQYIKMTNQAIMGNQQITAEMVLAGRRLSTTLGFIHGLAIAGNCILSSIFLSRWKKLYEEKESEKDVDSFLED